MDDLKNVSPSALILLNAHHSQLTRQQFKTLRGQILAGDAKGAKKGLSNILERRQSVGNATRHQAGRCDRQQSKD